MKKNYLLIICLAFLSVISNAQLVDFSVQGIRCSETEIAFTQLITGIDETNIVSRVWDFGDGFTSSDINPIHEYADSGSYNVTLTVDTVEGLIPLVKNKTIYVNLKPSIKYFVDTTEVFFSSFSRLFIDSTNSFNAIEKYTWDFGNGEIIEIDTSLVFYKYKKAGAYNIVHSVLDAKGCVDTNDTTTIVITDIFKVPNVFTPNGDGKNDKFIVTSNGVTLFSIDIYNRWGNLLFRREGHEQIVWDGKMTNGTPVKSGTYFYIISAKSGNVDYEPQSGFITIFY
ncbi:MAG: gliding motility-associated C-terminal domain-containing protein [Salinivirgaceae bacterium]|nr:gliding motility-associated C-terminal domain-containing protein [Salinivirgaceae bacterium]